MRNGERIWATWEDNVDDDEDFLRVGHAYEQSIDYQPGRVGHAPAKLLSVQGLLDFAVPWFQQNRTYPV